MPWHQAHFDGFGVGAFLFFAVFDRKVQCIAITRCNKYMYLIENH